MGDSKPPEAAVDLVASYARLVADEVEVVLAGLDVPAPEEARVVLRRGETRLEAAPSPVDDARGARVVARFPRRELRDGTWRLRLREGEGSRPLGCRLLVQGDRPLVLLWGQEAATSVLPVPHPRTGAGAGSPTARARRLGARLGREVSRRARRSR